MGAKTRLINFISKLKARFLHRQNALLLGAYLLILLCVAIIGWSIFLFNTAVFKKTESKTQTNNIPFLTTKEIDEAIVILDMRLKKFEDGL